MLSFEKLGAFYLGKEFDLNSNQVQEDLVMYDARDLTTHAVCVGMTGSGKTGLCIDLLEEAAIDSVPAIIIDPKGDITNLLLTFPDLLPEDFQPWINIDDARRKEMSVEEYAEKTASTWRDGLAAWGEGSDRIRLLKESAEFHIYTPGSDAGLPVSILSSLKAPALNWDDETELLREQIQGVVSALLGLVDIDADPIRSREHILLSNIFEYYWRRGEDLDLGKLIIAIQNPPIRQLGVFDIDTFFPEKDRFGLAMTLNNIMASPSFSAWLEGQALDIGKLLFSTRGKPRHSIFYIAHLSDSERMFFVTLLLEQVISWMRQQSGTTSLRALLYMDEVFGFFPPVANPPSKKPMLTLMKQARAFGLGVVLTTQNPVDLDYKGLTNAGTWFIGKLQTDRDKLRVLDGLESATNEAGTALNRRELDGIISQLGSRVFLLHNVHEDQPLIFNTRWAMSYLRGPLTREQIRTLMVDEKHARENSRETSVPAAAAQSSAVSRQETPPTTEATPPPSRPDLEQLKTKKLPPGYSATPPALAPSLQQVYLPVQMSPHRAVSIIEKETGQRLQVEETTLVYEPALVAIGRVAFVDRVRDVNSVREFSLVVQANDVGALIRWEDADAIDLDLADLEQSPVEDAIFGVVPGEINSEREIKSLGKDFADYLYHEQRIQIFHHRTLKQYGKVGESERDFVARMRQIAREHRDSEVDKVQERLARQIDKLEDRKRREQDELEEDRAEYSARKGEELLSGAETIAGFLGIFGRRRSLSTAATKRRMTSKAKADIDESIREIARLDDDIEDVHEDIAEQVASISQEWEEAVDDIDTYEIKPRRVDVQVELVALAWLPYWEIAYRTSNGRPSHDRVPSWH